MSNVSKCTKCLEVLPADRFYKDNRRPGGLRSTCKECSWKRSPEEERDYQRKWSSTPKGKWKSFRTKAKHNGHPISDHETFERFCEALSVDNCEVCGREFSDDRSSGRIKCIDHCHETGMIRGTLCMNCNSAEGYLGSVDNVRSLLKYLEKYHG